jgi:hypothetical protein
MIYYIYTGKISICQIAERCKFYLHASENKTKKVQNETPKPPENPSKKAY